MVERGRVTDRNLFLRVKFSYSKQKKNILKQWQEFYRMKGICRRSTKSSAVSEISDIICSVVLVERGRAWPILHKYIFRYQNQTTILLVVA